ncbi:hypothetical protein SAMN05421493_107107 [Pseudobutyrivibrio sp. 49]|uniref:hypothetical protein n=1 Tax=unclassified Pseudobutyrivibrio TaxID=2638619 RepID=UPI000888E35E|nr:MULTISPECIES: hypothetical protein [unclassified Pseudobutyrivibrio]SDI06963.1 hypothetical protein SAMN05421493_107107 [Pseudobutyrivibrio sp. 49]SFO10689.1 hypothetical protein SAMN04487831_10871 [Pseudobutyrivibrio sp. UC1225]
MKSRILMVFIVMVFICSVACGTQNISTEDIPKGVFSEEEIQSSQGLTEEEKKEIFDEYLKNMYTKEIMKIYGMLGCKLDVNLEGEKGAEKSVTVMYFYDPDKIEDVATLEDSIQEYISSSYPEAENVYLRGTPVSHDKDGEEYAGFDDIIKTLPAELNDNWNYIPIVPDK